MIYMFLSNNPSSGDINSSNLSCLVWQHSGLFLMDLEIGYKVSFLVDSSSTDIVIHDSR